MAWNSLITAIEAVITANSNNEITGQILQDLLKNNIVPVLGKDRFLGIATPATVPPAQESEGYYIAKTKGIYANFGGLDIKKGLSYIFWKDDAWVGVDFLTEVFDELRFRNIYTDAVALHSTINDFYLTSTGGKIANAVYKIRVYEVVEGDFVKINTSLSGSSVLSHAFFSDATCNTLVSKSKGETLASGSKTFNIADKVPEGATFIGVTFYNPSNNTNLFSETTTPADLSLLNQNNLIDEIATRLANDNTLQGNINAEIALRISGDKTNADNIELIKAKATYFDTLIVPTANIDDKFISTTGALTSNAGYSINVYPITAGNIRKIKARLGGNFVVLYAFYQDVALTQYISKGNTNASGTNDYDLETVPAPTGANFIAISVSNGLLSELYNYGTSVKAKLNTTIADVESLKSGEKAIEAIVNDGLTGVISQGNQNPDVDSYTVVTAKDELLTELDINTPIYKSVGWRTFTPAYSSSAGHDVPLTGLNISDFEIKDGDTIRSPQAGDILTVTYFMRIVNGSTWGGDTGIKIGANTIDVKAGGNVTVVVSENGYSKYTLKHPLTASDISEDAFSRFRINMFNNTNEGLIPTQEISISEPLIYIGSINENDFYTRQATRFVDNKHNKLVQDITPYKGLVVRVEADSIGNYNAWQPVVKEILRLGELRNFSVPGRSLKQCYTELVADALDDVNLVLVALGINDYLGNAVLGTIADTYLDDTIYGRIRKIIKTTYDENKWCKLGFVSCLPTKNDFGSGASYNGVNGQGYTPIDVENAILEVCNSESVPVLQMIKESGINSYNIDTISVDGIHPITLSNKFLKETYAYKVIGFIKNIISK